MDKKERKKSKCDTKKKIEQDSSREASKKGLKCKEWQIH